MKRWLLVAALLLPMAAMLASVAINQRALAEGSDWLIPVSGLDPRDPLRGQYVAFRYEWLVAGDAARCLGNDGCDLCLDMADGLVRATAVPRGSRCTHRVDVAASRLSPRPVGRDGEPMPGFFGRIFVSEASAADLEPALRAGPMAVAARLDARGRLVPRALRAPPAVAGVDARSAGPGAPAVVPPARDPPPR